MPKGKRPSAALRGAISAAIVVAVLVYGQSFVISGGKSWRSFVTQTPITPAWWSNASFHIIIFILQLAAVAYIWLPVGYSIDQKKKVLIDAVGLPWISHWLSLVAADALHLSLGGNPRTLLATSLAGSLAGFVALYGCLRRLHPLMVRIARAENSLRCSSGSGGSSSGFRPGGSGARDGTSGGALVATGTRWLTAYMLFRLPTAAAAALAATSAATDTVALATTALGLSSRTALNPSMGLLLGVMVLGIVMLDHLDDPAFAMTLLMWLLGLVVATHTVMAVKSFCTALVLGLAMRTAFKYVPEEVDEVKGRKGE